MTSDLVEITKSLNNIDITHLAKYNNKIQNIGSLSKMQASSYMQDFIQAIDLVNTMLSVCVKLDLDAKSALSTAEAIAYLDKASDYLKEKGIKESDGSKKMYVNVDKDVIAARDVKARTEATVVLLKNKLQIFNKCHDDVKKIGYADQNMTAYEGFTS